MKVLFVCSANKQRSATADDMFRELYPEHQFDSAGTNHKICFKEGTQPLTEDLVEWADLVYVMENKHRKIIKSHTRGKYNKKIKVLGIQDIYEYGDRELKNILQEKVIL